MTQPIVQPTASDVHIEILEPIDQTQVPADYIIRLRASASVESATGTKDLGDRIRWRSDRDGFLGQGDDITAHLTEGEHRIRAVVRRRGRKGSSKSSLAKSQDSGQSQEDDSAKDTVTVDAVPVDYSGGDT